MTEKEKLIRLLHIKVNELPDFDYIIRLLKRMEINIGEKSKGTKDLFYSHGDGKWNYYCSENLKNTLAVLLVLNCKSMIDLGCGTGLFMHTIRAIMRAYIPGFIVSGIEIEQSLIDLGKEIGLTDQVQGDICKANREIKNFDAIYFWEPITNQQKRKEFIENLECVTEPGQYIIYQSAGGLHEHINKSKKFKRLVDGYPYVYIVN